MPLTNKPRNFNSLTAGSPRDRKYGGTPGAPLVTGHGDVVVTLQPQDVTVQESATNAAFVIIAEARPVEHVVSYQWFINDTLIATSNTDFSGANTANLSVIDNLLNYTLVGDPSTVYVVMTTNDERFYRSQSANLNLAEANISFSPDAANLVVARGASFFINVEATTDLSPSPVLDYSWHWSNGTAIQANATISGVTSNQLHITATDYQVVANDKPDYFYVTASSPGGSAANSSNAYVFSVNVDTIPVACSVSAPAAAAFGLVANCRPNATLSYRWFFGNAQTVTANSLFTGVTTANLALSDSTGWTGNTFYCSISVSGATGTVNTTPVALTVA